MSRSPLPPTQRNTLELDPRKPEALDQLLNRLRWTILRPLARYFGGNERSLVRAPGIEIDEVREYQPGDDIRHIDWNITARAGHPFVREAYVERALDVWLILDVSASVDWGTARCLKRDRALEFAAVASQMLSGQGNRIGAILFADRPLGIVAPGAGRAHVVRFLASLRTQGRQVTTGRTNLAAALAFAQGVIRRRALVLIVSDFLVPNGWQGELAKLSHRHEVTGVRLRDPREGTLPDVGIVTFEDPETGDQIEVDTGDRRLRDRFAEAARSQEVRIERDLARFGVDQLVLGTDDNLLPALTRFLTARQLRRSVGHHRSQGLGR